MIIGSKYYKRYEVENDYYKSGTQLLSIDDNKETGYEVVKRSFKKLLSLPEKEFYKSLNWKKPKVQLNLMK